MHRAPAILALLAVAAAWPPPGASERLPLRRFDRSNGLGDDFVAVVRQDSRGNLWFGGDGVLSRFDAVGFSTYGRDDGIPAGWVSDVLESGAGDLYFATDGGVCRFAAPPTGAAPARGGRRFECAAPPPPDAAKGGDVRALHQDAGGRLWAATGAGLFRFEPAAAGLRFERAPLDRPGGAWSDAAVREIVDDAEGGLWLATTYGIAHRTEDGRVSRIEVSDVAGDRRIFALLRDSGGRLWIGHVSDGLYVWMPPPNRAPPNEGSLGAAARAHPSSLRAAAGLRLPERPGEVVRFSRADGLGDDRVRTGLLEDRDGAIWIGTVRGLARYSGGRLDLFGRRNGLPDDGTRPSFVDRAGNVWFGSPSGGAARLRRSGFTTYDESDGLAGLQIRSLFEGRDGDLRVVSSAGRDFVQTFDGTRFRPPESGVGEERSGWWVGEVALEDRAGDLWIASGPGGLLRYRSQRRAGGAPDRFRFADGDPLGDPQIVFEDRRGDLWVGSFAAPHVAVRRATTGRFEAIGTAEGMPTIGPNVFREDPAGDLWIGFADGTLGRFRDGRFETLDRSRLPRWNSVLDLHFDDHGRLWVGSGGGGLSRFDTPANPGVASAHWGESDGLSSNDVTSVLEDARGRIYAGSLRGVDRLDPSTGILRRLTTADGLANNLVRTAYRDRHGDLWFGTPQGLSRLSAEPEEPPLAPAALLTALEVNGVPEPLPEGGAVAAGPFRFAAGSDRIRIGFVAPSADLDEAPAYRYRLAGLDDTWSAPTRDRAVNYAGLSPGDYRFEVRAVGLGGEEGATATVAFTLPPPLWRRWWALTAFASLLLGGAFLFHRQRLARVVAVERVRTRIAADLHDDLGASLSRIAVLSEVARRNAASDGRQAPELVEIAETARQITDEAGDIVWSIDPRQDDLASLLRRLRPLAADLLSERGIALDWSGPADAASIHLAPDQRRHLLLILKEALHNAARHSGARRVSVRVDSARHLVRAEVSDDGRGFDAGHVAAAAAAGGGRGLPNLRARAKEAGGRLVLLSAPGAGTTVKLELPR